MAASEKLLVGATHATGPALTSSDAFQDARHKGDRTFANICADAPVACLESLRNLRSFRLERQDWKLATATAATTDGSSTSGVMISLGQSGLASGATTISTDGLTMDMAYETTATAECVAMTHPIFRPDTDKDAVFYAKFSWSDRNVTQWFAGFANMGAYTTIKSPFAASDDGLILATIDGVYFSTVATETDTISITARQDASVDTASITMDSAIVDDDVMELAFRINGDDSVTWWANNLTNTSEAAQSGILPYVNVTPASNDYEPMSWCIAMQSAAAGGIDTLSIHESWCWSETSA